MAILDKIKGLFQPGQSEGGGAPVQPQFDEKKIEGWINTKWAEIKNSYLVYHMNMWRSRIYYSGEFWINFDKNKRTWQKAEPNDSFVPQPEVNRFSPAVDAICSNFNNVPEVEAVPVPRDDDNSISVAEVANDLATHFIKENALKSDYKSDEDKAGYAAQEFVLSGCVFSFVYPEEYTAGRQPKMQAQPSFGYQCLNCDVYQSGLPAPVQVCPQCGQPVDPIQGETKVEVRDDQGQVVMEDVRRKKIVCKMGDPGFAYPRPGARNMADTPYLIWAERMTLDDIWRRWQYEASADNDQPDGYNVMYEHSLNFSYMGYAQATSTLKDAALVVQCYAEPGKMKEFPEGFYGVVVGGKAIYCKPWDEAFCEHPATKGDFAQIPSLFFPRSLSFDLAEIQKYLVELESIIELHAKTSAVEPIVIEEQSKVSEITGRLDKIIYWRAFAPGVKEPHRMAHGSLDESIYRKIDDLKGELENISHVVSVFKGEQPGSITAASAIQTLRGQAELMFSKPVQNWAGLWKETVRKGVKNYQRYMTVPEIAEIVGNDKITAIESFKAANLDKTLEFIATNSGLPKTRDEKRQEMMTLFDKGALDVSDPNVRQKIFELFGETGMMKTFNDDSRRARVNMKKIRAGEPAEFRIGIDDADIHLGIALETAKSLDFDQWEPQSQQFLFAYIDTIRQSQIQEAMAAIPPPGMNAAEPVPSKNPLPEEVVQ